MVSMGLYDLVCEEDNLLHGVASLSEALGLCRTVWSRKSCVSLAFLVVAAQALSWRGCWTPVRWLARAIVFLAVAVASFVF